eukprot:351026-Chlamydomonas_euryale.AAC.1
MTKGAFTSLTRYAPAEIGARRKRVCPNGGVGATQEGVSQQRCGSDPRVVSRWKVGKLCPDGKAANPEVIH